MVHYYDDQRYSIINAHGGWLQIKSFDNAANVKISNTQNSIDKSEWYISAASKPQLVPGIYYIKPNNALTMRLEMLGGEQKVKMHSWQTGNWKLWRVEPSGSNPSRYLIENVANNLVMTGGSVGSAGYANSEGVIGTLVSGEPTLDQLWEPVFVSEGVYSLRLAASPVQALDSGGAWTDNSQVKIYAYSSTQINQKWTFEWFAPL